MSEESPAVQLEKLLNTPVYNSTSKAQFSTDPVHKTGIVSRGSDRSSSRAEINDIIRRLSSRRSSHTTTSSKGFERRTKSLERLGDEANKRRMAPAPAPSQDYDIKPKSSVKSSLSGETMASRSGARLQGKEVVKRLLTPDDIRPRPQSNINSASGISGNWNNNAGKKTTAIPITAVWPSTDGTNRDANANGNTAFGREFSRRRREGSSTDSSPAILSSSISPGPSVVLSAGSPNSSSSPHSKSIKSLFLKSPKVAIRDFWNKIKSPRSPRGTLPTPTHQQDNNNNNNNILRDPVNGNGNKNGNAMGSEQISSRIPLSKSISQSNISLNTTGAAGGIPSLTPEKNLATTPVKVIIREDCGGNSTTNNSHNHDGKMPLLASNQEEFIVHDDNSWEELLLKRILVMKSRSRQPSTTSTPMKTIESSSLTITPRHDNIDGNGTSESCCITPKSNMTNLDGSASAKSPLSLVDKKELEDLAKKSIENILKEAGLELKDLQNIKNVNGKKEQRQDQSSTFTSNVGGSGNLLLQAPKDQKEEEKDKNKDELDIYTDLKSLSCPLAKEARRISIIKEFDMKSQDLDSLYSNDNPHHSNGDDNNEESISSPHLSSPSGREEEESRGSKSNKFTINGNDREEILVDLEQPAVNVPLARTIRRTGSSPNHHHWFLGDQHHQNSQATLISPASATMSLSNLFLEDAHGNGSIMGEDLLGIRNTNIISDDDRMTYQNYKDCMRTTKTMLPVSFEELLTMIHQVPIIPLPSNNPEIGIEPESSLPSNNLGPNYNDLPCLFLLPLNGMTVPRWLENGVRMRIGRELATSSEWLLFKTRVISRVHAEIFHDICDYYINDVGSKSGTWINGQRLAVPDKISPPRRIANGDIIQFGIDHDRYSPDMEVKCVQVMALIGYPSTNIKSFASADDKNEVNLHPLFRKPIEITMPVEKLNKMSRELTTEFKSRLSSANCRLLIKFGDFINETSSGCAVLLRPDGEASYSFVFNNYKFNWEIAMTRESDGQILLLNLIRNSTQIYQIRYNGGTVDGDDCCRLVSNGKYKVVMEPKPRDADEEEEEERGNSSDVNANGIKRNADNAPFFNFTGDLSTGKLFIIQRLRNSRRQIYLGEGQMAGIRTKWGKKRYYFEARLDEHSKYDDLLSMSMLYFILQQLHTI